jgi:hypothetical protein
MPLQCCCCCSPAAPLPLPLRHPPPLPPPLRGGGTWHSWRLPGTVGAPEAKENRSWRCRRGLERGGVQQQQRKQQPLHHHHHQPGPGVVGPRVQQRAPNAARQPGSAPAGGQWGERQSPAALTGARPPAQRQRPPAPTPPPPHSGCCPPWKWPRPGRRLPGHWQAREGAATGTCARQRLAAGVLLLKRQWRWWRCCCCRLQRHWSCCCRSGAAGACSRESPRWCCP